MKEQGKVESAITMILSSEVPLTTSELIHRQGMDHNHGIYLRRVLSELTDSGVIRRLPAGPDGSHSWIKGEIPQGKRLAHVLNIYLAGESDIGTINPDVFEQLFELNEGQLYENNID
ncbi:MAG: hypothetical protein GKR90_25325 [Pseudomonadales bacterium]|nr:hypothetical protein [Pseudomonadales bacterium]